MRGVYRPFLSMQYRKERSPSISKAITTDKNTPGIAQPLAQLPIATPSGNAMPSATTIIQNRGDHFPANIFLTEILPVDVLLNEVWYLMPKRYKKTMTINVIRNICDHCSILCTADVAPVASMIIRLMPRPPQMPSMIYSAGSSGVFHSGMPLTKFRAKPAYATENKANIPAAINSPKDGDAH